MNASAEYQNKECNERMLPSTLVHSALSIGQSHILGQELLMEACQTRDK